MAFLVTLSVIFLFDFDTNDLNQFDFKVSEKMEYCSILIGCK